MKPISMFAAAALLAIGVAVPLSEGQAFAYGSGTHDAMTTPPSSQNTYRPGSQQMVKPQQSPARTATPSVRSGPVMTDHSDQIRPGRANPANPAP